MRAIIYHSFQGTPGIETVPDPTPLAHGVVLKVKATGLCRSDWHGWMGHDPDISLPHVPGHELAGEIVELGSEVTGFKIGDRVTVPFVCGCGNCEQCASGNQQVCDHQSQPGFTHWGSFAEYVRIDKAMTNLVPLPESIDDITAASLGCRFITAYRAVVDQGKTTAGNYVAVHGCGGVGLSAIMIAKALGAQPIAIDINQEALSLASRLGAVATINATETDQVAEAVKDISRGGVHVSLDALGSAETSSNSINNLRKRGKHIQVGLMTGDHKKLTVPMDHIMAHELEIIGSHGMQAHRYPEMLELIESGKLNPKQLVTSTLSLEEAVHSLTRMNQFDHSGVMVINMESGGV